MFTNFGTYSCVCLFVAVLMARHCSSQFGLLVYDSESINLIIRGVHQVCSSLALRRLFIYILQIGNLLNFGSESAQNGTVGGFSLNSLVKLSQTKAFVGGITFLQYVVQSIEVRCACTAIS